MVKQLLTFNRSKDIPPGKPKFPWINPDEIDYPNQLNLFVGAKSWLLFNFLNIDGDMLVWMQVPVVNCEKMSGYHKLKGNRERIRGRKWLRRKSDQNYNRFQGCYY
jgi:hypothetical protein